MGAIRPLAIGIFWNGERLLVEEGYDPVKQETFYRPLGGGIEFGERSAETLHREIREEINAEITDLRYLGTLENIFVFDGAVGHEIVQIYEAAFVDRTLYDQEQIDGYETGVAAIRAMWLPLERFAPGGPPLYPDGLYDLLVKRLHERA